MITLERGPLEPNSQAAPPSESQDFKGVADSSTSPGGGLSSDLQGFGNFVDASNTSAVSSAPPPGPVSFSTGLDEQRGGLTAVPGFLRGARHPGVCMAHLTFKLASLLTFVFGSFVFGGWKGDYVFTFVVTTIFLSLDFWTVKNVSGRILVGMRWWNDIKDDGSSEWVYESLPETHQLDTTDKTVFWTALYIWPICWSVFLMIYIFRLDLETCLLVILGLVLSGANLVGYWKCSKDQKKRVTEWASNTAFRAVMSNMGV